MNTIIVPVDFSETSVNAARYAAQMGNQVGVEKIILYNTYGGSYQILDSGADAVYNETHSQLHRLSDELKGLVNADIKFEEIAGDGFLLDDLKELVDKYSADLIVMGITGKNTIEQKLIGSNTMRVATEAPCPVLIVPSKANFSLVKNVALSLKFKAGIMDETPHQKIKKMINALKAHLIIINVADENHRVNVQNVQSGLTAAHLMFDEVGAEIAFIEDDQDVVKNVTEYVQSNDIQLLISITHKQGFLASLFKGSVTKKLAFYTDVPLMVFKAY